MDVFFPQTAPVEIITEDKTRTAGAGVHPDMSEGQMTTTQTGIIVKSARMAGVTAVLFPRLKTEKAPTFTSLAGGKAVKVQTTAGTDYVFLSAAPFKFEEGDIQFEGTSGLVKMRGGKTIVALGSDGSISARGQKATRGHPHPTQVPIAPFDQVNNGDFESGQQDLFFESDVGTASLRIQQGNPVVGDTAGGKYSLAFTYAEKGGGAVSSTAKFAVDPEKTYRLKMRLYAPHAMQATVGGYAFNGGTQLKNPDGQVWQYDMVIKGPTDGWQTFETTIGPPGSGARHIWHPQALITGFAIWVASEKGTFYLDDISFQEVKAAK